LQQYQQIYFFFEFVRAILAFSVSRKGIGLSGKCARFSKQIRNLSFLIMNTGKSRAPVMQISNLMSVSDLIAQRPISASTHRWELARTGKQLANKARVKDVAAETVERNEEPSGKDFQRVFNRALFVGALSDHIKNFS
jgi:hypothetical protein